MDWLNKKFHYKIVRTGDKDNNPIAFVYKQLGELEEFIKESKLQIKSIKRTGLNDFIVEVSNDQDWYL